MFGSGLVSVAMNWYPSSYDADFVRDLQGSPDYDFLPLGASHAVDGALIQVTPVDGPPWSAMFGSGHFGGVRLAIAATPSKEHLLVVAGGQGYLIPVLSPSSCMTLPFVPITALTRASSDALLISTLTFVVAIGAVGVLWESDPVSMDGFDIISLNEKERTLFGKGYNPHVSKGGHFRLDLADGAVALLRDGEETGEPLLPFQALK